MRWEFGGLVINIHALNEIHQKIYLIQLKAITVERKVRIMLKKLWPFIFLLSCNVIADEPDPYVEKLWDKKYLKLPSGQEVILARLTNFSTRHSGVRIFVRKGKNILWDKTYDETLDTLWVDANFIPLIENKFIEDLNNDGFPEIGVATNHGGNNVGQNVGVIFTVREDKLEVLKTQEINIDFSRYIYKTKDDFKNPNYKCPICFRKKLYIRAGVLEK